MSYINNFDFENTKTRKIDVTATSAAFAVPVRGAGNTKSYDALEINNTGSKSAFLKFGVDNTVSAVAPLVATGGTLGDYCIPAGAIKVVNCANSWYAVVTEGAETTTVFVTPGHGS